VRSFALFMSITVSIRVQAAIIYCRSSMFFTASPKLGDCSKCRGFNIF